MNSLTPPTRCRSGIRMSARAQLQHPPEAVAGIFGLAAGDRRVERGRDAREPFEIPGRQRLLEPGEVELLQPRGRGGSPALPSGPDWRRPSGGCPGRSSCAPRATRAMIGRRIGRAEPHLHGLESLRRDEALAPPRPVRDPNATATARRCDRPAPVARAAENADTAAGRCDLPSASHSAPSSAEMPTTGTPLWPRKLMSFQARAQKSAMWPASRPTTRSRQLVDHRRAARCVRRLLSVKIRFSPTTPVSQ